MIWFIAMVILFIYILLQGITFNKEKKLEKCLDRENFL